MLRARLSKRNRYFKSRRLLVVTCLSQEVDVDIIADEEAARKVPSDDVLSVDSFVDDFTFDANLRDRPAVESTTTNLSISQLATGTSEDSSTPVVLTRLEADCVVAVLADLNDELEAMKHLLPEPVQVDFAEYKSLRRRFGGRTVFAAQRFFAEKVGRPRFVTAKTSIQRSHIHGFPVILVYFVKFVPQLKNVELFVIHSLLTTPPSGKRWIEVLL